MAKRQIEPAPEPASIVIAAPRFAFGNFKIVGTSPYVQNRFGPVAVAKMVEGQMQGSRAKKGALRKPKDFDAVYKDATRVSREGWHGIPAPAIRDGMISTCRLTGFKMTLAKLSLFVQADGFDADDGMPLVRLNGKPRVLQTANPNANGSVDIRWRPIWDEWWAVLRLRWDADQFSDVDVANLLARLGAQVGLGAGRYDSKNSPGLGWGCFEIAS